MGDNHINRRFGIKAQLMALLITFFLLLVFFTSATVREQISNSQALLDQQELLNDAVRLNNIAYQLYQDLTTWQATQATTQTPNKLPSLKFILEFHSTKSVKRRDSFQFKEEQIANIKRALDENDTIPSQEISDLLLDLQLTSTHSQINLIDHIISLNPLKELTVVRSLALFSDLHYKQGNLINDGLTKRADSGVFIELLNLSQTEGRLRKNTASTLSNFPLLLEQNEDSSEYQVNALIEKQRLISELIKQLGYEGTIHQFKNLVLRGPEKYEKAARQKVLDTVRTIDTLSNGFLIDSVSRIQLLNLLAVIIEYSEKIEITIEEWKKGTPINEIDRMVRVNDSPAIVALETLQVGIYQRMLKKMRDESRTRIDSTYKSMSDAYFGIQQDFRTRKQQLDERLQTYLIVSIAGSILLLLIVAAISRRIISRIEHIKKVLHHMETYTDLNIRADEDGKDEIGDIAVLLNNAISHRQDIEESLANQTKKAQQAAKAKMSFLSGMSHEMKTPLNSIIGYSQRLLSKKDDANSREYDALNTIHENGNRLLDRITHILKLVDIDDLQELAEQHCCISHFHQALIAQETSFTGERFTLFWEAPKDKLNLVGTPEALSDIASHLCDASNFPSDSKITLHARLINQSLILTTRFEDPTIDPASVNSLFNEGDGLVNLTSNNYEGSNLNLAIIKSLCDKLGGGIDAELVEQEVTYRINIPCA